MTTFFKDNTKEILILLLGNFILAVAVTYFIVPYGILTGGVFGVSIALGPIIPNIDVNYIAYFIIFLTFILGAVFLGRAFAFKTVVSSVVYPMFLEVLRYSTIVIDVDPLLAALYSGILSGVALGFVFRSHASTGGMDVFPLLLKEYFNLPTSQGLLFVDGLTVMLGISTLGIEAVLLGLMSVWATSYTLDKVLMFGGEQAKSVLIISEKLDIINNRIHLELDRGTTIINAFGGYGKTDRDIIMCVITHEQYPGLKKIVSEEDEEAFVIVQDAKEIMGEGFQLGRRV